MARFEIVVVRRPPQAAGAPTERRLVLGRFGAALASLAVALLVVAVVVTALVLGYIIAGFVIAAMIAAILVVMLRGAFRALRRR